MKCDAEGAPLQINDYVVEALLGAGSFGRVYKARLDGDPQSHRRFALKLVHRRRAGAAADTEVATTRCLYHANVALLFEAIRPPMEDDMVLVQEFMAGGPVMEWYLDEASYLRPDTGAPLDADEAAAYLKDVVTGLAYLRGHGIVHRDIKPDNLLIYVYEDGRPRKRKVRICDFGCAKQDPTLEAGAPFWLRSTEGTMAFWSPEACRADGGAFDGFAADLWAAGVCLYCFTYGALPTDVMGPQEEVLGRLRDFQLPEIGDEVPRDLHTLLEQMLLRDEASRLSIPQILATSFVERRVAPDPAAPVPLSV